MTPELVALLKAAEAVVNESGPDHAPSNGSIEKLAAAIAAYKKAGENISPAS